MEPGCSLPHSQEPANCPFTEPDQSIPCPYPTSWIFILILSSHLYQGLRSSVFPSGFLTKTMYAPLLSPTRATFLLFLILLNFVTQIIFNEEYRLWSSSLCCLLRFLVALSLLDLNIFPRKSSAKSFLDRRIWNRRAFSAKGTCLFSFHPEFAHDAGPLTNVKLNKANLLWRGKAGTSF